MCLLTYVQNQLLRNTISLNCVFLGGFRDLRTSRTTGSTNETKAQYPGSFSASVRTDPSVVPKRSARWRLGGARRDRGDSRRVIWQKICVQWLRGIRELATKWPSSRVEAVVHTSSRNLEYLDGAHTERGTSRHWRRRETCSWVVSTLQSLTNLFCCTVSFITQQQYPLFQGWTRKTLRTVTESQRPSSMSSHVPVVLRSGISMSHYTHMFYEFMFLQEEVKETRHHLKLLEKYYRYFVEAICHDLPDCQHLKSSTKKKGQAYVRATLFKMRKQHPHIAEYIQTLQHSPVEFVAAELQRFHIDLSLFARMDNPKITAEELKHIVVTMWEEIKQTLPQVQPRRASKNGPRSRDRKKTASSIEQGHRTSQSESSGIYSEALLGATAALIVGGAVLTSGAPLIYSGLGMLGQGVTAAGTALSGTALSSYSAIGLLGQGATAAGTTLSGTAAYLGGFSGLAGAAGPAVAPVGYGLGTTLAAWGHALLPYSVVGYGLSQLDHDERMHSANAPSR